MKEHDLALLELVLGNFIYKLYVQCNKMRKCNFNDEYIFFVRFC